MRVSIALLIFFILFNGWAGLLQDYGIDDHIGINAETGDPAELDKSIDAASEFGTGNAIGGTLIGMWNALGQTLKSMFLGLQPGAQMIVNIMPPGPAEDIILWAYSIIQILMAADILAYLKGADL